MGVYHRRSHVAVAEQLLNRADGLASLQQISATTWPQASVAEPLGMPEGVAADRFGDSGGQLGSAERLLDQGGIQVVTGLPKSLVSSLARPFARLPAPASL